MTLFAAIRCRYCGTFHLLGTQCDCRTKLPPVIIGEEGNAEDQVRYAIKCVCGDDRVIEEVEPALLPPVSRLPDGAKLFYVTSICGHESRCEHIDKVYWYKDRSVAYLINTSDADMGCQRWPMKPVV